MNLMGLRILRRGSATRLLNNFVSRSASNSPASALTSSCCMWMHRCGRDENAVTGRDMPPCKPIPTCAHVPVSITMHKDAAHKHWPSLWLGLMVV